MNEQERRAYEIFKKWAKKRGLDVRDCRHKGKGYDYETIDQSGKTTNYEVKGSKHINRIPDLSVVEFDDHRRLKADFLFVVGNILDRGREIRYKIPRDAIKPENLRLKQTYRIERFQNKKIMGKFVRS